MEELGAMGSSKPRAVPPRGVQLLFTMATSKRFESRAQRPVNRDSFIREWPETGLVMFDSPCDPKPSLRIEGNRIVELDGTPEAAFDMLDRFIARHAIDLAAAPEAMALDPLAIARMLVDINVPRDRVARLIGGLTPARMVEVANRLNVLEMMMALQKMRARRTPSNQAHVTNRKENPALLAADAAEAVERGFSELETTVGVSRYAPFNAMAVLIGSQTGGGTALTQCAVEESLGLRLALLGLTTYAETLSVYGTEQAFLDGDDTPWSKAFLASAYASRGIKVRFTSGSGSEALMGHSEGKSMIYLETRCLMAVKGAGSQGVQNGSISCIALPESLPGGVRGVLAENLIAAMLDLEVASGNDAMASHSEIRKSAKLMLQFLPGTDFIFSGYSSMPREDNLFGGGNLDTEDLDDYNVLQRDMQVDGGLRPIGEDQALAVRRRAALATQAVFEELGLPPITDAEVEAAVLARSSADMPERDVPADLEAAQRFLTNGRNVVDIIRALARRGYRDIAEKILAVAKVRMTGDFLQTSAVLLPGPSVLSAVNDPNDYRGPGTGYALSPARKAEIDAIPQAADPHSIGVLTCAPFLRETGEARTGTDSSEIVIAVGPAFGSALGATLLGLPHKDVLASLVCGIEAECMRARFVKVYDTSDLGKIGFAASALSGSGVAVGIQSKGTTVIHRRGLNPLDNLELFPQAPNLTLESYVAIGRNAASYALGRPVRPVPVQIDNMARLKYIVRTTILHLRETEQVVEGKRPRELAYV